MATLFEIAARIQAAGGAESTLLILVKATLVLAIARLLLFALPRASAATKHLIATAALVGVAAMPVLTFVIPAWNVVVASATAAEVTASPSPGAERHPLPASGERGKATIGATGDESSPSTIGTAIGVVRATGVVPDEPLTAMQRAMNITRSTWKGMIVVAVAIVTLMMLAQMLIGILGVWYVARRAEEVTHDEALLELDYARDHLALGRDVRLLRSSRISVPVLWGFFRPVLLLPVDVVTWPAERLRVVLLHELAHLKRYDGMSLILTRIAACVFWYHPLAWSLERAGRNECERACDDLVLASGTKPSEYADHLLAIARSMPTFDPFRSVTLAMSRKSQLEGRLLSILQPHVVRRVFSGRRVALACAIAVALIIPISAIRLTAEPSKETKTAKKSETKSDSTMTVTPDVEALEDYLVAKLGKYDKRIDKLAREPENGHDWYERAYNLYHAERHEEAAAAFRRAADEDYRKETSLYNAACAYALLGDADRAIPTLEEAIEAGWDDVEKIANDSDFDPIRSDPRFARALNDTTGEVAQRRVTETMQRYENLKEGKITRKDILNRTVVIDPDIDPKFDHDVNIKLDFNDDHEWYDVGLDLLRLRRFEESIQAFQKSIEMGQKESSAMYNIACAYSLRGDAANGIRWLDKAIEAGYGGDEKLQNDPDLAFLRKQRGFDDLRRRAKDLELRGCCDKDHDDDEREGWREVMEHHRAMTQKYPSAGRAWFNLGFAALQAREMNTGIDAFHRAIQLGHRIGTSSYNIACGHALAGDRDAAFEWLNKARDTGFELHNYMFGDDDLEALHDDPRWQQLRSEVKAKLHQKLKEKTHS